eukprot:sb/3463898/
MRPRKVHTGYHCTDCWSGHVIPTESCNAPNTDGATCVLKHHPGSMPSGIDPGREKITYFYMIFRYFKLKVHLFDRNEHYHIHSKKKVHTGYHCTDCWSGHVIPTESCNAPNTDGATCVLKHHPGSMPSGIDPGREKITYFYMIFRYFKLKVHLFDRNEHYHIHSKKKVHTGYHCTDCWSGHVIPTESCNAPNTDGATCVLKHHPGSMPSGIDPGREKITYFYMIFRYFKLKVHLFDRNEHYHIHSKKKVHTGYHCTDCWSGHVIPTESCNAPNTDGATCVLKHHPGSMPSGIDPGREKITYFYMIFRYFKLKVHLFDRNEHYHIHSKKKVHTGYHCTDCWSGHVIPTESCNAPNTDGATCVLKHHPGSMPSGIDPGREKITYFYMIFRYFKLKVHLFDRNEHYHIHSKKKVHTGYHCTDCWSGHVIPTESCNAPNTDGATCVLKHHPGSMPSGIDPGREKITYFYMIFRYFKLKVHLFDRNEHYHIHSKKKVHTGYHCTDCWSGHVIPTESSRVC